MNAKPIDRTLLITVLLLVVFGFIIFTSASLGLLARDGAQFGAVALKQFMFGIVLGFISPLLAIMTEFNDVLNDFMPDTIALFLAPMLFLIIYLPILRLMNGRMKNAFVWFVLPYIITSASFNLLLAYLFAVSLRSGGFI